MKLLKINLLILLINKSDTTTLLKILFICMKNRDSQTKTLLYSCNKIKYMTKPFRYLWLENQYARKVKNCKFQSMIKSLMSLSGQTKSKKRRIKWSKYSNNRLKKTQDIGMRHDRKSIANKYLKLTNSSNIKMIFATSCQSWD